ncbi:MAG: hypothetical protein WD844_10865 [Thermoleophilaceae bacterium]
MNGPESVPERPLDLMGLLAVMASHHVDYLVVGGVAVQVHGHRRTTKDLDVVPAPQTDNYERLAAALDELEAHQRGVDPASVTVSPTDPERLRLASIVPPLTTMHGELHILNEAKGGAPWEQMRARALVVDLDGVEVAIVGLDDLIRMKRAAGRKADIAVLTRLAGME